MTEAVLMAIKREVDEVAKRRVPSFRDFKMDVIELHAKDSDEGGLTAQEAKKALHYVQDKIKSMTEQKVGE